MPVGPFLEFPSDGVWIVKDAGHSSLIMKLPIEPIEDIKQLGERTIKKSIIKEVVTTTILQNREKSIDKIADIIAENLLKERKNCKPF